LYVIPFTTISLQVSNGVIINSSVTMLFLVSILTIAIKFLSYFFVDETEDPIDSII